MKTKLLLIVASLFSSGLPCLATTAASSQEETALCRQWCDAARNGNLAGKAVFSFLYEGKPSGELLATWGVQERTRKLDPMRSQQTFTWNDPTTGLEVRCVSIEYADYPAVEWTVYFRNNGDSETPILSEIRAVNAGIPIVSDRQPVVYYAKGSDCRTDDFEPQSVALGPTPDSPQGPRINEWNAVRLQSKQGRSSCSVLPFFNIDLGGRGAICAVGWTGDWAADIFRTDSEACIRAGMPRTHLKLLPGEEIRSPKIVLLFWNGERIHGHNLWRQFVLAHHSPKIDGRPARVPVSFTTWGGNFAEKHIEHGRWWKERNLPIDYLWVDAGWYGNDEAKEGANVFNSNWGALVGDWFPNPGYFPEGLAPVSKALKEMNLGFLLWFEPERAFQGTTWTREHPEYFFGPIGPNYLMDLGNPAARQALTDHLVDVLREGSISCYRQDFNCDPRPFWDAADAPDRIGMSEIRHIMGLYQLWDDLLMQCPGLLIDNCSSGGRRIDIEAVSRSVPLWRSDVPCYPNCSAAVTQNHTHGLAFWVPLSAAFCDREDTYSLRSAMGPGMNISMPDFERDSTKHFDVHWLRAMLHELDEVRDLFLGDFYPLLTYSGSEDDWAAWQYDRPDRETGAVLCFRRVNSPFGEAKLKLHGLDSRAVYVLTDFDAPGATEEVSGSDLLEDGLPVRIDIQPGSKILLYKRKP